MDVGKALQYPFDDEQWPSKLGLGALITMIPILNLAWVGYFIEIMRNVTENKELPLPGWEDLGDKFIKGLLISVAGFIYALPGLLFLCLPIGIFTIPAFIQDQDAQGAVAYATTFTGVTLLCCIGIYFLAFTFLFPAVQLHYSRNGTFQSCFQLRQIFRLIFENIGDYMVAWLFVLVATFLVTLIIGGISAVTSWILCLGQMLGWVVAALGGVWTGAVYAHIFGQFGARVYATTGAEILPPE